jgi:hypothetical protein
MPIFDFKLVLDRVDVEEAEADALYARCKDGTLITAEGATYMDFDRQADSLDEALRSHCGRQRRGVSRRPHRGRSGILGAPASVNRLRRASSMADVVLQRGSIPTPRQALAEAIAPLANDIAGAPLTICSFLREGACLNLKVGDGRLRLRGVEFMSLPFYCQAAACDVLTVGDTPERFWNSYSYRPSTVETDSDALVLRILDLDGLLHLIIADELEYEGAHDPFFEAEEAYRFTFHQRGFPRSTMRVTLARCGERCRLISDRLEENVADEPSAVDTRESSLTDAEWRWLVDRLAGVDFWSLPATLGESNYLTAKCESLPRVTLTTRGA